MTSEEKIEPSQMGSVDAQNCSLPSHHHHNASHDSLLHPRSSSRAPPPPLTPSLLKPRLKFDPVTFSSPMETVGETSAPDDAEGASLPRVSFPTPSPSLPRPGHSRYFIDSRNFSQTDDNDFANASPRSTLHPPPIVGDNTSGGSGTSLPHTISDARYILDAFLQRRCSSLSRSGQGYLSSTPSDDENRPISHPDPAPSTSLGSSSASASSNKSPVALVDVTKRVSVQSGRKGEEKGDGHPAEKNYAQKNYRRGEEVDGLPSMRRPSSPTDNNSNTLPAANRRPSSAGSTHISSTLPRGGVLESWSASPAAVNQDKPGDHHPRERRHTNLFQNLKDFTHKRHRTGGESKKSKSDSEAQTLSVLTTRRRDPTAGVDSQESVVNRKKSKMNKERFKGVVRMMSLSKEKDTRKHSRPIDRSAETRRRFVSKATVDEDLGDLTQVGIFKSADAARKSEVDFRRGGKTSGNFAADLGPTTYPDTLRDSKGRRISRDRINAQWDKKGAVVRADFRPEDDPGTLGGESSSDEEEGDSKGFASFKKFFRGTVGLNVFRKRKKKKNGDNERTARGTSCHPAIDVTKKPASDAALEAPLAEPEDSNTPEHKVSNVPSSLPPSMSDSQVMTVELEGILTIGEAHQKETVRDKETLIPVGPRRSPKPLDINSPSESIELMDQCDSLPFDQLTDEQRQAKIDKVVAKLEEISTKISNSPTPTMETATSTSGSASSEVSSAYAYAILQGLRDIIPSYPFGSSASETAPQTTSLSSTVDNGDLPYTFTPSIPGTTNQPPISPESGVVMTSEAATPDGREERPPTQTSNLGPPGPSGRRRASVPRTLNLDLNRPEDRALLYKPILQELLRPTSEFAHFSRIASTVLQPLNRAGQLAKFFEITSNAVLMTGSPSDQERLKEWALRYFEENLAPYIVDQGWEFVLDEGGGAETETSRDSELD